MTPCPGVGEKKLFTTVYEREWECEVLNTDFKSVKWEYEGLEWEYEKLYIVGL